MIRPENYVENPIVIATILKGSTRDGELFDLNPRACINFQSTPSLRQRHNRSRSTPGDMSDGEERVTYQHGAQIPGWTPGSCHEPMRPMAS